MMNLQCNSSLTLVAVSSVVSVDTLPYVGK